MAELNTGGGGGHKGGKVRSKKQSTRVDLTAMVDLAFLLITFFMLTTTLAKPQAMDVNMPDKDDKHPEEQMKIADNRTLNILLTSNNKMEYYMGSIDKPIGDPTVVGYGKNGIRKVLIDKGKEVIAITGNPNEGMIVLIKPTDKSNYKNLVDILDEMKITNVTRYAIVDVQKLDVELLKRDKVYE